MRNILKLLLFSVVAYFAFLAIPAIAASTPTTNKIVVCSNELPATLIDVPVISKVNSPPLLFTMGDIPEPVPNQEKALTIWQFVKTYGAELFIAILALLKIFVRITPSVKDDEVFGRLDRLLNAIFPNLQTKSTKART